MAERRITFQIDIDLAKGSKEAHARTVNRFGQYLAEYATEQMELRGYTVRQATGYTTMHYVRHALTHVIKQPKKIRVRKPVG